MTEIVSNNYGWVLDQLAATEMSVLTRNHHQAANGGQQSLEKYRMKSELFKILMPFVMDSQMHKVAVKSQCCGDNPIKRRKRKRKEPLNVGEQMALDYHEQVRPHIQKAYTTLVGLAQCRGAFQSLSVEMDNNLAARTASQIHGAGDALAESSAVEALNFKGTIMECLLKDEMSITDSNMVNTVWHYEGEQATMINLQSGKYLLPPACSFLMSDIDVLLTAYSALGKFDLIVLDPPWENKSVKRKKKYSSLPNEKLLDLPLHDMASPGCLVLVWVTNRNKHIEFVTEQLFPKHGITFLVKWFWLKVTCCGELVCDLESAHKCPYETLIIGQVPYHDSKDSDCRNIPTSERTIISVPCSVHSKKPYIYETLKSCLPLKHRCLEMFARNLQPHWTSWGNEVLLHQHIDFFERVS